MDKVGVLKSSLDNLKPDVDRLLEMIGYRPSDKKRVLLKPNIVVNARPEHGAATHPGLIEALARWFQKKGKEVVVAEGTGIYSSDKAFARLVKDAGYAYLRDKLGIPLVNLEQEKRREVTWAFDRIALPELLWECEYVNVPTLKTHVQTTVSLAVKNQKGLIPMETKKRFHQKGLHERIYELSRTVKPDLTLVDGFYCIEGDGPTGPPAGTVKKMDLLLGGTDMMAVDNISARIMDFDVQQIRHLEAMDDIEIIGEPPDRVRSDFAKPSAFQFRTHDHFLIHMDERACTLCTVSFYQALSKILYTPELYAEFLRRPDMADVQIVLGPIDREIQTGTCVLCLGSCSARPARKKGYPRIKGCNPDYREIVNFFFPGYYRLPEKTSKKSGTKGKPKE
ncbi:MAG: DUF362 domain-containing protein [Desulfobacteraceae bacterium]|nr:DUF362 domain-containing protein [Desulfobacteraceae bacterium]